MSDLNERIIAGVISGIATGVVLYVTLTFIPQEVAKLEEEEDYSAPSW